MTDVTDLTGVDPVLHALATLHGVRVTAGAKSSRIVHVHGVDDGFPADMPEFEVYGNALAMRCQVLVGADIAYVNDGRDKALHIKQTVSQELADDLVGRPVGDMVQVPGLENWTIARTVRRAGTIDLLLEQRPALAS